MPDAAAHLLAGGLAGRVLRLRNLHVILLGTLLPDLNAVLGTFSDLGWLKLDAYRLALMIAPMSSVFAHLCICAAVALCFTRPAETFGLLALGAATHMLLDMTQVGHVEMPLYPFSFRIVNWPLHNYGEGGDWWLSGAALLGLVLLRLRPQEKDVGLEWRRGWLSALPLLVMASVLVTNSRRLEHSNVLDLAYLRGTPVPEGQQLALVSGRVISSEPLVVRKCRLDARVVWPDPVATGRLVSVWGRWQSGALVAERLAVHAPFQKILFSALGLAVFASFWLAIKRPSPHRSQATVEWPVRA